MSVTPSYNAVHLRLTKEFGPAKTHLCAECLKPARHWAFLGSGSYSDNMEDYAPMCVSCHFRFDNNGFLRGDPSAAGKKGIETQRATPEFLEIRSENGRRYGAAALGRKRRCLSCGMVTSYGGVGKHKGASGHTEWEDLI